MIKKILNYKYILSIVTIASINLIVSLINFYGHYLILGNDLGVAGMFWKDILNQHFYIWGDYVNAGIFTVINLPQIINIIFQIFFSTSSWFGLFILLTSSHFLFFELLREFYVDIYKINSDRLKLTDYIILVVASLPFLYNFYTLGVFTQPSTSYNLVLIIFPLIFLLFYRYFKSPSLQNIIIFTIALSIALVINLAHFAILIFLLLSFVIFIFLTHGLNKKISSHLITAGFLFILFGFYFFLPVFLTGENPYYGYKEVDSNNVNMTVNYNSRNTNILNVFQMRETVWLKELTHIYNKINGNYLIYLAFIPLVVLLSLVIKSNNDKEKKYKIFFLSILVIGIFLTKAYNEPFIFINNLFYRISPFAIFRSSYDKFILLISFTYPFLLVFSFKNILNKNKFIFVITVLLIFLLTLFPFSKKILNPKYKVNIPLEYLDLRNTFKYRKLDATLLVLPNYYLNGYVQASWISSSDFYPTLLNKKVINELFLYNAEFFDIKNIENLGNYKINQNYLLNTFLAKLFNLSGILVDKTFKEKFDAGSAGGLLPQLGQKKSIIAINNLNNSKNYSSTESVNFNSYELKREFFLPHIYVPRTIMFTRKSLKTIPPSTFDPKNRIAIYFKNKIERLNNIVSKSPILEFKKINPTKYRVIVHEARGEFPLVFSESFHDQWKSYLVNGNDKTMGNDNSGNLLNYKILDGNVDDQASEEELKSFIDKGWITTLGDDTEKEIKHMKWVNDKEKLDYVEKYNIDFISKNFQDTIQNDNLPNGSIFETWFKKPIDDNRNHLVVNGYANSWNIDVNKLCTNNSICKKNPDGSYDFEIVVEFWPQRLFYIGVFISGTTLVCCLLYLALLNRARN